MRVPATGDKITLNLARNSTRLDERGADGLRGARSDLKNRVDGNATAATTTEDEEEREEKDRRSRCTHLEESASTARSTEGDVEGRHSGGRRVDE